MTNNNQINEPDWPVSFEDVEKDHLMQMLTMTPAQRLALAEELLDFAISTGAVKDRRVMRFFNWHYQVAKKLSFFF